MATEAVPQLLGASVDAAGLSVVSATMTAEDLRNGSMYNPVVLAAGVPMWFHALQDGRYVALFRSYWINATVGAAGPQSYTGHTEVTTPCWVTVTPPQGHTVALGRIPSRVPGTEFVLNAAASRVNYLFTVGNLDGAAIVQHHRVAYQGGLVLDAEELMFGGGNMGVLFDKGCYIDGDYLVVLGTDADDQVYACRRLWSRIGVIGGNNPWEYRGAKGWLRDPLSLAPMGLTSVGPVSVATVKDRLLVSTVADDAGVHIAQVFQARVTDPWGRWKPDPTGASAPLGAEDDGTYLGGTLYFQPQLERNPAAGVTAGVPYVTSVKTVGDGEESIDTAWGLWPL